MADLGQIIVNRVKPLLDTANSAGYETGYGNGFDSGYVSGEESVREYVDAQVEISKKAIIGRGGDISSDAGLEDLPNAIFNIPADASLAHYTDGDIAYRKSVPVGAEKYALLKSVGGMTYKSKNLIPYPYQETTKTENGITFTDNGDGSVTLNGTATATFIVILSKTIKVEDGTYTVGKISNASNKSGVYAQLFYKASDNSYPTQNISNQPVTLTMSKGIAYSLQLVVAKGITVSNITVYPMFNEGTTALPPERYYEGLRDSKTTQVISYRADGVFISTKPIPKALQDIDGYGWGINADCYNYVDWGKKQFVKRVEKVVFDGSESGWYAETPTVSAISSNVIGISPKAYGAYLCDGKYLGVHSYNNVLTTENSFAMGARVIFNHGKTLADFKSELAVNPVTIHYELAEPVITDISDILTDDGFIEVESGGSLEFVNEYKYAVPSTIKYTIKVGS